MNNFFTGSFSVNEGKINRKRKRSLNNWDKEQLAKGGGSNVPNMNSSFNKANTMQTNKDGENVANINVTETKTNEAEDNNQPNKTTDKKKKKKKSKSQKRFPNNPELRNDSRMFKYWSQRYNLFERFDMGIKLDKESWYSVTAEYIAKQQAELCKETDTVLDGFCGAGGNSIQFCFKCSKVIAVDIDPVKIELTKNNCHVYGVDMDKITIMKEDFYSFANQYTTGDSVIQVPQIDVVFLSPPWGGQNYLMNQKNQSSSPDGIDLDKLISTARLFKPKSIMIYLPRNTDDSKLRQFVQPNESVEIIKHDSRYKKHIDKKIKAITAVFRL